ncbi:conserved hypothetical protein [Leishmania major strain Friedlin]|uniref:Uncharacterized protein n=1 Tax=Leishmania major TaxID=5664 RepID=Q4QJ60_LEIMA|nr:conserved hypothetical protein [Leishmania major strain Friedlin]CAG9568811.1 hypothetical_protein_-_conserved [Leishmania major strain Friedlin]CAJ02062.1 conserved hypothetical protein [Leishmania major strain Friedlin]|eukprot:XP_001680788.1 conserved hypothetical protein [Leishmania major strain Friedlin]
MLDRSCRGGATSTLTNAEASAFYLTALVAQALRLEDYWVHLGHQIEVDQHVEFIQYCAREGFGALKTMHLLNWWRQYRSLVRGDADVCAETPITPLLLSDGNPQRNTIPFHFHSGNASCGSAGGGEHGSAGGSALSHGKEGSGGRASKKGRRLSTITAAGTMPSSEQDGLAGTAASLAAAAPTPLLYATHAEALHGELQRFVQWELEHEWAWRQVPREPVVSAAVALTLPRSTSLSSGPTRSTSGMTAAGVAKPSRAEKAKLQQLQQQEMEAEEQRLARVAAMPPENIFLTKDELDGFLQFVVEEDLLSHTALHMCMTSHAQQPMNTLSRSARAPVHFSVQVETPMSVLPLREAARLSALQRSSGSGNVSALSATRDEVAGGDATVGGAATPQQPPRPTAAPGHGKPVSGRPRAHSKRAIKGASKDAAAATAAEAAAVAASNLPAAPELTVPPTAMEALRAEQAKEAAAYQAAYEEELAQTAAHQRAEQHAADVHLFFEKPRTNEAVQAVYASIECALAARQQRILQRVVALERALGLSTPSAESDRLNSAGASPDGSGAAAAASKPTTSRGASSSGVSTPRKRKAK